MWSACTVQLTVAVIYYGSGIRYLTQVACTVQPAVSILRTRIACAVHLAVTVRYDFSARSICFFVASAGRIVPAICIMHKDIAAVCFAGAVCAAGTAEQSARKRGCPIPRILIQVKIPFPYACPVNVFPVAAVSVSSSVPVHVIRCRSVSPQSISKFRAYRVLRLDRICFFVADPFRSSALYSISASQGMDKLMCQREICSAVYLFTVYVGMVPVTPVDDHHLVRLVVPDGHAPACQRRAIQIA
jgi:hypothetical protein